MINDARSLFDGGVVSNAHEALDLLDDILESSTSAPQRLVHLAVEDNSPSRPVESKRAGAARPRRVLLVENDPTISAGIGALLEFEGIEVKLADRGGQVRAALEQFRPDAVVLDIGLPDIDGMEVYRQAIEKAWPTLPVVFSSGHGLAAKVHEEIYRPHVGFLQKPYDTESLMRELTRVTAAG